MEFVATLILALPAFEHNGSFFIVIASHDAGDPVPVFETAATCRTDRSLLITLNEKRLGSHCKQDSNLIN